MKKPTIKLASELSAKKPSDSIEWIEEAANKIFETCVKDGVFNMSHDAATKLHTLIQDRVAGYADVEGAMSELYSRFLRQRAAKQPVS